MNLNALVTPYIAAVNPLVSANWYVSTGWTPTAAGKRIPTYGPPIAVMIQDQALSGKDLQHIDGLNLQGVFRSVYLSGNIEGVNRPEAKGGDKFTWNGRTWLVVLVTEPWSDSAGWTRFVVQLQNDGAVPPQYT